uniref:Uncharacterized protein n=1 Tax=Rhizophora mucronata TaxID=61149 RepID=A0A2P2QEC7_RHIMU
MMQGSLLRDFLLNFAPLMSKSLLLLLVLFCRPTN